MDIKPNILDYTKTLQHFLNLCTLISPHSHFSPFPPGESGGETGADNEDLDDDEMDSMGGDLDLPAMDDLDDDLDDDFQYEGDAPLPVTKEYP